jgi:hypothetical protein
MHVLLYAEEWLEVRQLLFAYIVPQIPQVARSYSKSALNVAFDELTHASNHETKPTLNYDVAVGVP